MKAAVCRAFKKPLSIEEVQLAEPGPGEVKVRIAACAICHSDILFIEGAWGGELPAVLGHEAAGIVEAGRRRRRAGRSRATTSWSRCCAPAATATSARAASARCARPGCRSICARRCSAPDGSPIRQGLRTAAFAEQVVVHASQVARIPREVPLESASLLACGVITGLGAVLNTAAMRPGGHVATIGTGGVGLNCVQGAAIGGARTNIAIDLSDRKLAAARTLGRQPCDQPRPGGRPRRGAIADRRARRGLRLRRRRQRCRHRAGRQSSCAAAARWWSSA